MHQYDDFGDDDLMTDDEDELPSGPTKSHPSIAPPSSAPLHLNTDSSSNGSFVPSYPSIFYDVDFRATFNLPPSGSFKSNEKKANNSNPSAGTGKSNAKKNENFYDLIDLISEDESDDDDNEVRFISESKNGKSNYENDVQFIGQSKSSKENDAQLINKVKNAKPIETSRPTATSSKENVLKVVKTSASTTRRFNQQFSETQYEISSILEKKRALREKNSTNSVGSSKDSSDFTVDSNLKSSTFRSATPERRAFGRAFSPTYYTPSREERFKDDYNDSVSYEIGKFLKLLLSVDICALQMDYFEDLITNHLRNQLKLPLPDMSSDQLPLTYNSVEEYKNTYIPFILYDCWAQLVEDFYSNGFSRQLPVFLHSVDTASDPQIYTLSLRCVIPSNKVHFDEYSIENWLTIVQLDLNKKSLTDECNWEPSEKQKKLKAVGFVYSYNKLNGSQRNVQVMPKHLPVVSSPDNNGDSFVAYTECEYLVKLYANDAARELIKSQKGLTIRPIYYIRPTLRYIETISLMKFRDDFKETFLKPDTEVSLLNFNKPDDFYFYEEDHFNEHQKKAILACYNAINLPYSSSRIVPIQGPPGTGKTHTLVGIVKNMFINCKFGRTKPLRILICAPSNGAIDEIALRLIRDRDFLKEFKDASLSIIRIGQRSQVHPDVKSFLLENMVEVNYKFCSRSRPKADLREDLLKGAHVILSTLSSVQLSCMSIFRKEFATTKTAIRCVIVDEASQSTEPELLMPLIYPVSKLILIGDHLQLPATVISRHALRKGYGRSMFERLFLNYEEMSSRIAGFTNPMITLRRQFRMNHAICNFPSAHFYRSLLETPLGTGKNPKIPIRPYFVFDVANANERSTTNMVNSSKFNVEEAEFIFRLIMVIFAKLGYTVTPDRIINLPEKLDISIGIITFYRGQKQELIKRLQAFDNGVLLNGYIDINTVDAFQGQERDIVILSCVRAFETSSDINSVGFVRSQQRMNVALTRAKSALYVMIHAKSFINVPRWQQLLTDAQARNCFVRLTSQVTNEMLMKKISPKNELPPY